MLAARYDEVDTAAIPLLTETAMPRTLSLYGSSKAWGEELAHVYAHSHGMSCFAIRTGWVVEEDRPPSDRGRNQWCSRRDIAQLCQCCVDAPADVRFDIFYGMSDNAYNWVDLDHARDVVGYMPLDSAEDALAR